MLAAYGWTVDTTHRVIFSERMFHNVCAIRTATIYIALSDGLAIRLTRLKPRARKC